MASPHYKGSTIHRDEPYITGDSEKISIKPRALDITWGGDRRYWQLTDDKAELVQVSWLEVNGSVDMKKLDVATLYKLEFKVRLTPDAFGWKESPVYIMAKEGSTGRFRWKNADLSLLKEPKAIPFGSPLIFTTPSSKEDKVHFGLFEIWKGRWKGGLVIEGVEISKYRSLEGNSS